MRIGVRRPAVRRRRSSAAPRSTCCRWPTGLAAEGHDITVVTSCATSYEDWADVYAAGHVDRGRRHGPPAAACARRGTTSGSSRCTCGPSTSADLPLWPWAQDRWAQMMGPDLDRRRSRAGRGRGRVRRHGRRRLPLRPDPAPHADRSPRSGRRCWSRPPTPRARSTSGGSGRCSSTPTGSSAWRPRRPALVELDLRCGHRTRWCRARSTRHRPARAPTRSRRALDALGLSAGRLRRRGRTRRPGEGQRRRHPLHRRYRRAVDPDFELVIVGPGEANVSATGVLATGFVDEATKTALVAGSRRADPALVHGELLARPDGGLAAGAPRPRCSGAARVLAGHVDRSGGGMTYGRLPRLRGSADAAATRPEVGAELGARGRRYVRREFDWTVVAPAFVAAAEAAASAGHERLGRARSRA